MHSEKTLPSHEQKFIQQEIRDCQTRVLQTLVPTILALGLIAVSDPLNISSLSLECAFAVLFSSSMYVASLSFKIFRNSTFLFVFARGEGENTKKLMWSDALKAFNNHKLSPFIIRAETTTAALIYTVLAITFCYVFISVNFIVTIICTAVLLIVALRIFGIYRSASKYKKFWTDYKENMDAGHAV